MDACTHNWTAGTGQAQGGGCEVTAIPDCAAAAADGGVFTCALEAAPPVGAGAGAGTAAGAGAGAVEGAPSGAATMAACNAEERGQVRLS
jgi:hypothetical protein